MYRHIAQVQNSVIQYPSATKFRQAIHYRECTGKPRNYVVYGRPGVGKTTLRKCIEHEFPPIVKTDRTIYTVLSVTIPTRPTTKNVGEAILVKMGDPIFAKGGSTEKSNRIAELVKDLGVKAFIFDEMQHFVDGGNKNTPGDAAEWLKTLIDDSCASTILLGTDPVKKILDANSAIKRRYSTAIELKPFSISTSGEAKEFAGIIRHIDKLLNLQFQIDYNDHKLIEAIHFATNGIMDYMMKLLIQAYELAFFNGYTRITRALLEEAFTECIWLEGVGKMNPFNPKFVNKYLDYEYGMPFKNGGQS
jgi:Bacterial TniB protein